MRTLLLLALLLLLGAVARAAIPDIDVAIQDGDLVLTGVGGSVTIEAGLAPTQIRVTGGSGTLVNGTATVVLDGFDDDLRLVVPEGATFNLNVAGPLTIRGKVDLRAGAVGFLGAVFTGCEVQERASLRSTGAGTSLQWYGCILRDDLKVETAGGNDGILIASSTQVHGNARLDLGGGTNGVTCFGVILHGKLWVRGEAGNDVVSLSGATIRGAVTLRPGAEANSVGIGGCTFEKGLKFRGADAHDTFLADTVQVHGKLDVNIASVGSVQLRTTRVGGDCILRGGAGLEEIAISADSFFEKDLRFFGKDGDNELFVSATILDDLIVRGGSGMDILTVQQAFIGGDVRCDFAAGLNSFHFDECSIGDDVLVEGGAGIDALILDEALVHDAVIARLGSGTNHVTVADASSVRRLRLTSKAGNDTVILDHSSVSDDVVAKLGAGDNEVALTAFAIGGNLVVKTGDGDDVVSLGASTTIAGKVSLKTGKGDDTLP